MKSTLSDVRLLDLPKIEDIRGNLTFVEEQLHVPFSIERAYWIYDVPGGQVRGAHAFKEQQEFIIALSGSFDVLLDDGTEQKIITLNRSYHGLYVPPGLWREMINFSTNSLALVVSSTKYSPDDYIRDYAEYQAYRNE
jgi:dTDP-4-dehydrorhamnose 3,5-epimerase-like enzyme